MTGEAHDERESDRPEQEQAPAPIEPARRRARGALDPILSVEDGLVSAMAGVEGDSPAPGDRGAGDPWAHRRGEPRMLALFWSVYLFGAAVLTVMRIPMLGQSTELRFVQSASRMLLLLIAVGMVVLWPMVRLSQASPRRPVVATMIDLSLLLITAQAVIWPLTWLGKWPASVTAGVTTILASWTLLVGALVAMGVSRRAGRGRSMWMLVVVALVCGAPGLALLAGRIGSPIMDEIALASPLTGVYALTTGPSGLSPAMNPTMWAGAWAPAALSIPLWFAAPLWAAGARRSAQAG